MRVFLTHINMYFRIKSHPNRCLENRVHVTACHKRIRTRQTNVKKTSFIRRQMYSKRISCIIYSYPSHGLYNNLHRNLDERSSKALRHTRTQLALCTRIINDKFCTSDTGARKLTAFLVHGSLLCMRLITNNNIVSDERHIYLYAHYNM